MSLLGYSCLRCASSYPFNQPITSKGCPKCLGDAPANLFPIVSKTSASAPQVENVRARTVSSLWRYAETLPVAAKNAVSLCEGLTPLLDAQRIGSDLGVPSLFIKDEGRNPTWSHKDRFSTVLISHAVESGAKVVATASSGNAGASLAAYAAAAGISCVVATFASTAGAMVSQTGAYGATVVPFQSKQDRWLFLDEGARRNGWLIASPYHTPVVGSHPIGIAGYKTLAYEVMDQMEGDIPDWCILPVCYGDALAGLWQGFKELAEQKRISKLPKLVAAEVYGSLSEALTRKADKVPHQPTPFETVAVSIGAPRSTFQALNALRESGGAAVPVTNEALLDMQRRLARREGLFAELASVAPLVALKTLTVRGTIKETDRVVAVVTASGLKDLDRSEPFEGERLKSFSAIEDALQHVDGSS